MEETPRKELRNVVPGVGEDINVCGVDSRNSLRCLPRVLHNGGEDLVSRNVQHNGVVGPITRPTGPQRVILLPFLRYLRLRRTTFWLSTLDGLTFFVDIHSVFLVPSINFCKNKLD